MQLTAFVDAGGTLVDTADVYCDGESERTLGHLLSDVVPRSDVLVATKAVGRTGAGPMGRGASRGHLLAALDASLERLGLDYVDLWQLHAWDEATPLEETLAACDLAVSSGRARYIGISNFTGWQTAQAATWQRAWPGRTPLVSTQVEYSLLQRGVEREVVPAAEALGLGVLAVVAAGPRDAHRQVPAQHAVGVPRRLPAVAGLHRRAALGEVRPDRRGRDHRRRGAGHHPAGRRAGLGARPARRRRADRRRPHRPAAAGLAWTPTACGCPPRSAPRWRTSRRRRSAIPSAGRRDDAPRRRRRAAGDPVFAAFCAAGLWPGLGRRTAAELPAAGITSPDDVTADRLIKLPEGRPAARRAAVLQLPGRAAHLRGRRAAGRRRPARPSSPPASPTPSVRTPPAGCATTRGRCSSLTGVTLGDADRLAIAVLKGADRQDSRRGRAIVGLTLRTATRDGHTVLPADLVVAALQAEGIERSGGGRRGRGRVRRRAGARAAGAGGRTDAEPDPALRIAVAGPLRHGRGAVAEGGRPAGRHRRSGSPTPRRCAPSPRGWTRPAGRRRAGAGGRRQPAHRRSGHRQEPHGGRDREAAARQGHRHRARRAHRPRGQAAGGAHRPPGGHRAPAARGAGHDRRVRPQRGVAAGRRRRSSSTRPRCWTSS